MVRPFFQFVVALCALSPELSQGQTVNLSGTWRLNVQKSTWGSIKKPVSVTVNVRHQEPAFGYRGTVMYDNEDSRDFVFEGAIDGKGYPMTRSYGSGVITIQRMTPRSFDSVFQTEDGRYVEASTTTVSANGWSIRRVLHLKTPTEERRWTEIYERR